MIPPLFPPIVGAAVVRLLIQGAGTLVMALLLAQVWLRLAPCARRRIEDETAAETVAMALLKGKAAIIGLLFIMLAERTVLAALDATFGMTQPSFLNSLRLSWGVLITADWLLHWRAYILILHAAGLAIYATLIIRRTPLGFREQVRTQSALLQGATPARIALRPFHAGWQTITDAFRPFLRPRRNRQAGS